MFLERQQKINRENDMLKEKMAEIKVTQFHAAAASVDKTPRRLQRTNHLLASKNKVSPNKTDAHNQVLADRLQTIRGNYSRDRFSKDHVKHLALLSNLSTFSPSSKKSTAPPSSTRKANTRFPTATESPLVPIRERTVSVSSAISIEVPENKETDASTTEIGELTVSVAGLAGESADGELMVTAREGDEMPEDIAS